MGKLFFIIILTFFAFMKNVQASHNLILDSLCVDGLERQYYKFSDTVDKTSSYTLFVFLHGLTDSDEVDTELLNSYSEMKDLIGQKKVIFLFPIGLKGIYSKKKDAFAWWPDEDKRNLSFLQQIVSHYKNLYHVETCILGGFSNGAFFASFTLQNIDQPFDGFWLQGGGQKFPIQEPIKRKKVVLEIGVEDNWHLTTAQALKKHLLANGWENKLLYRELQCGHRLNLQYFMDNVNFLTDRTGMQ